MENEPGQNKRSGRNRKRRSQSLLPLFLLILSVLVAGSVYLLYQDTTGINVFRGDRTTDTQQSGQAISSDKTTAVHGLPSESAKSQQQAAEELLQGPTEEQSADAERVVFDENIGDSADDQTRHDGITDSAEQKQSFASTSMTCEPELGTIKSFYRHLDEQEYLKPYQLGQPSEIYFSALLQKVVDNPPIVTGETDDLFNILKNTAHFFRIFGKKNIYTLKAILDREKESFEKVLSDFYKLTGQPDCLRHGFGLSIPESALYDYAGFFLNTMGGRLYLFRRDSVSRMAVSYYSILIVDQANRNGTNEHGVDIAPLIKSLIEELENNGSPLRMRNEYLNTLYALEEKYM